MSAYARIRLTPVEIKRAEREADTIQSNAKRLGAAHVSVKPSNALKNDTRSRAGMIAFARAMGLTLLPPAKGSGRSVPSGLEPWKVHVVASPNHRLVVEEFHRDDMRHVVLIGPTKDWVFELAGWAWGWKVKEGEKDPRLNKAWRTSLTGLSYDDLPARVD